MYACARARWSEVPESFFILPTPRAVDGLHSAAQSATRRYANLVRNLEEPLADQIYFLK